MVLTPQVLVEDGALVFGIFMVEGHLDLPPKQWLRVVRATMREIEDRARQAGFAEIRLAGRDWSRVLPDYEFIPGETPNLLRKRL